MRHAAGWALLLLLHPGSPAQALEPGRHLSQYQRTRWERRDGLPVSSIEEMAQTADGSLWIGSVLGVTRFDGRHFTSYRKAGYPALPTDDIRSLAADGEVLWVGTTSGAARLENGQVTAVPGTPADLVKHLLVDAEHRLWLATPSHLLHQEATGFREVVGPDGQPLGGASMALGVDGAVWIDAAPRTLWRWKGGTLEAVQRKVFLPRLAADPDGSVWGLGDEVLAHVGPGGMEQQSIPAETHLDLARDGAGNLWLASGLGLTRRSPDGRMETLGLDQIGGLPTHLLVDREGALWVGTEAAGLLRLRDAPVLPWSVPEGLASKIVYTFFEDEEGAMWITSDRGVNRFRNGVIDAPLGAVGRPIIGLQMERGRVWLAAGNGLVLREGGRERRMLDALVTFMARRDDGLWASTQVGLLHFRDGKEVARYGVAEGGPRSPFLSLRLAEDGSIWVGHREGVCRFDGARFHCFGPAEGGPHGEVLFIHQDRAGDLWLGTSEDGLYRFHQGRFTRFTTADGLPSDSHYAILEDDRGRLWTTSSSGIARIDKASLGAGPARVRLYTERDGMRSADCFGGGVTGIRARDGRLWFATADSVATIDPTLPDADPPRLEPRVEELTQSRPGWLSLRYAAPSLGAGDLVSFRHQLTGFDTGWIDAAEPVAAYTNVPPGTYRFLAQARIPPGPWSTSAERPVTVPARWFQTLAFRLAAVAAILLLGFALHRLRLRRLVRQTQRLEAQVAERTRAVEEKSAQLAEANATLEHRVEEAVSSQRESERMAAYGTMVAGVAHEVRQPIFALGTTAYVLQQQLADRADVAPSLALVARETKRVNALMDELLEFARPPALTLTRVPPGAVLREAAELFRAEHDPGGSVTVRITEDGTGPVPLDEARIVQVLLNLMGNAKKHAPGITTIGLESRRKNGHLELVVENDGGGISAEHLPRLFEPFYRAGASPGSGLGLAIVRRLVELHGGSVQVSSALQRTRFVLALPAADG